MRKIIFTGGGSGGHVVPALTLIDKISDKFKVYYIGGSGIEKELVTQKNIPFKTISTGKLRRYFSIQNMIDLFKVGIGFIQSFFYLLSFSKNTIVFSTGGFVSVPVVLAAFLTRKKIYIHEQTSRVGLANRICSKFATKIFISFKESEKYFPQSKTVFTGYPVRDECYEEHSNNIIIDELDILKIKESKKIIFITGGGNGAKLLNDKVKELLNELTPEYFIIHQVGKNFIEEYKPLKNQSYLPLPFLGKEMIDILKVSDVIISRSGAGTVCELLALGKPSIFIPLKIAQKNEQFHNAMEAKKRLNSIIIEEDDLSKELLLSAILEISKKEIVKVKKENISTLILNYVL